MAYTYVPRMSDVGLLTLPYYNGPPNPFTPLRIRYYQYNSDGTTHHGECTTYAYGRWLEIANGDVTKLNGLLETRLRTGGSWNGGAWYVASNPSVRAGKTNPQPGDILCLKKAGNQSYAGHVCVVEEVHFGYIITSDGEHSGKLFNTVTRMANLEYTGHYERNYYQRNNYHLEGFIRMTSVPSPPAIPDFNMPTEWVNEIDHICTDEEILNNSVMAAVVLSNLGWTLEAIAGALGNFKVESFVNPGMREFTNHNNGGLVGWTPLTKWSTQAVIEGVPWNDGDAQCRWIDSGQFWSEGQLQPPDAHWDSASSTGAGMSYSEYKASTLSPDEMARLFMRGYEKPLHYLQPGGGMIAQRQEFALYIYDYLLGINLTDPERPYNHHMPVWMMAGNAKPKLIY